MKPLDTVSINGRIRHRQEAALPFESRSFFVGEGLFETLNVSEGKAEFLDRHLERLLGSAGSLGLPAPNEATLRKWLDAFLKQAAVTEGMLRITLTRRGVGGFNIPSDSAPVLVISGATGAAYSADMKQKGVSVAVVRSVVRPTDETARHKTTSYLPLLLARREAEAKGAQFAVILNRHGRIAEADCANVFIVRKNGPVVTPPVEEGALPGVIRRILLERVENIKQAPVTIDDLLDAEAVFLTNSLMPVIAVSQQTSSATRYDVKHPAAKTLLNALAKHT